MVINQEIILIIIFIVIVYFNYKINKLDQKSLEKFDNIDDINNAVKRIYLADVEAIRILSNFAIQLSQGGFTVPGNIKCTDTISAGPNNETFIRNDGIIYAKHGLRVEYDLGDSTGMFVGTGDGADNKKFSAQIRGWWGLGFVCSYGNPNNEASIWFNLRDGIINCKKFNIVDDYGNVVSSWDKDKLNVTSKAKLNVIGLAGYVFNNLPSIDYPFTYPIVCSMMRGVNGPVVTDDGWLINPGYKIVTYKDNNYANGSQTFDNYNGDTAKLFNSNPANLTRSWKVYFNNDNNEVRVDGVS
jgi:hypothetical protein